MDYKSKYLKYKQKYLIQIGGGKIFDLSKTYKYKKGELQKNLKQFEKDYGNNFKLKYNGITIDVELKKIKLPSKLEFYSISYDIPHRTSQLKPLRIDFLDITNSELNNILKLSLLILSASANPIGIVCDISGIAIYPSVVYPVDNAS